MNYIFLLHQAFPKNETDHMEEEERKFSAGLVFEKVTDKLLFFRFEMSHFTALQRQPSEDLYLKAVTYFKKYIITKNVRLYIFTTAFS